MIKINSGAFVNSVNISKGGIPKLPIDSVFVQTSGLKGDGHNHKKHYRLEQAVSLQDMETLSQLNKEGYSLKAGSTGENVNVCHLRVNELLIGTRLVFSGGVEIEITRMRPPCYVLDAIDPRLKIDILGRCGAYAKVICEGTLQVGETVSLYVPPAMKELECQMEEKI